jgi:hypothetical protein
MVALEITGDIPEIIGNEENLYKGHLILYFRTLFYNANNLKNPTITFGTRFMCCGYVRKHVGITKRSLHHVKCATCSSLRYFTTLIILAILIQANRIRIG